MKTPPQIIRPQLAGSGSQDFVPAAHAPRALIDYDFESALTATPRHRLVLWLILGLVFTAGVGLWLAKIDVVVAANGKIVTSGSDVVMQALETSVVRSFNVKMGQTVKAGDVLVSLDPTFTQADEAELAAKLSNQQAAQDRLEAEAADGAYAPVQPNSDELTQLDIFRKRRNEYLNRVNGYESKIQQYKADVSAHDLEAKGLNSEIELISQEETMYQQLLASNLTSKLKLLDVSQRVLELKSRLSTNLGEQDKLRKQIDEAVAERDAFIAEWKRKLSEELAQTRSDRDGTAARLSKARLRHAMAVLTAPRDATVLEVAPRPAGSVVREAETLVRLVPTDEPLLAELQIDTRDIARLSIGDRVVLKLEALPWQQFGLAHGTLKTLTPDTLADQNERETAEDMVTPGLKNEIKQGPVHYRARVEITDVTFHDQPEGFVLKPGLRLVGDIKVGRRSVLDYILNPITRGIHESLREP